MSPRKMVRLLIASLATMALLAGILTPTVAANELSEVSVALTPQADTVSLSDGVDTYLVKITSHTSDHARYATARIPFTSEYRLANTSFNRDDIWVSLIGENFVELTVVHLIGNRDYASAMLSFVSQGPATRNALVERATVTWPGDRNMPHNHSNLPVMQQAGTLSQLSTLYDGTVIRSFRASPFASNEPVNLWYTSEAGVSTALVFEGDMAIIEPRRSENPAEPPLSDSRAANSAGEFQARVKLPNMAAGTYTLVACGGWSGTKAVTTFTVR
jgi:hypothetical protein